ncbi:MULTISPECIES: beta-glucosidase BglX [unclassified Flavobacterium]|uniref:beta-glucosidase BglX n=1 Tax=unclassified Flavobacterium TaxID=196869 RepID=UPI001F137FF8|nr:MULTISPECIES: beta-glucosidase BglX [unclassified Flavobacterium]UMY66227.1 beta-glucosidase BglX [Flavobacterium sp. HJ-32-4]
MKHLYALLLLGASFSYAQNTTKDAFLDQLLSKMTLEEKIGQLNLISPPGDISTGAAVSSDAEKYIIDGKLGAVLNMTSIDRIRKTQEIAVTKSRLKIPLLFGLDVIHGYKTQFPIPLGLSATWDPEAVQRAARIAATEATADGIDWTFSPMCDISRDPRWGRVAEGFGEDPLLGSKMAAAMVKGYQGQSLSSPNSILACVKHFALYGGAEAGRDYNTVDMSLNRMYNEYFPPYKAAVDAGAGSVMTSFNDINGVPSTANKWLLTNVLRDQWHFGGFVVTDFTAIKELIAHGLGDSPQVAARSLKAGTDMDMVGEDFLNTLATSVKEGKVTVADIDHACRRILSIKYDLGLFRDPFLRLDTKRRDTEIFTPANRSEARRTAASSFVLMKNERKALPLPTSERVAFIGPLLDDKANMPGTWAVAVESDKAVTLKQALNERTDRERFSFAKGCNLTDDPKMAENVWIKTPIDNPEKLLAEALAVAKKADRIVLILGEASEMTGESASRSDIAFPENQLKLVAAMRALGKPMSVVLFTGRPLDLTKLLPLTDGLLNVWFPGTEAGYAIADVLFGDVNPSGKLTMTFPRAVGQVPIYYNHKNTGRPIGNLDGKFEKYRSNYLDVRNEPLFPFGFGLSYTTFEYSKLTVSKERLNGNETLRASITVKNTGRVDGTEVVQLYIRDQAASITRPVKELKGFQKISLAKGESRVISFDITPELLSFYNEDLIFDWEAGAFDIMIGTDSENLQTKTVVWEK